MILHIETKEPYRGERLNGLLYPTPKSMLYAWTVEEMNEIGLAPVTRSGAVPAGMRRVEGSRDFTLVDGYFIEGYTLEPIPEPTAEELEAIKDDALSEFDLMLKISFNQENRIRARENRTAISEVAFRDWVKGQM